MRIGEMIINGKDAYINWGVYMDETCVSVLMTPASNKDYIYNESPLINGKKLAIENEDIKVDSRDLTLNLNFSAAIKESFFDRYNSFCQNILAHGKMNIETKYIPGVVFKCMYVSCQQFQEWMFGLAKYELKLIEPNPVDRNKQKKGR